MVVSVAAVTITHHLYSIRILVFLTRLPCQPPRINNHSAERDVICKRLGPPGSIQHNSWPPDATEMWPSILLSSQASLRRTFLSRPQLQFSSFMLQPCPMKYLYTTFSPLIFADTGFEIVDTFEKLEEETIPVYNPENYYPAHIGQVLLDKYQIVGKLGYGVTSTVWLGRDLQYVVSLAILTKSMDAIGIDLSFLWRPSLENPDMCP